MKKAALIFILILFLAPLFANKKYSESKYFFTDTRLKLREDSDLSSKVITVLDDESCVLFLKEGISESIDDRLDNWVKVKSIPQKGKNGESFEGWVFGGYLNPAKEVPEFSEENKLCLITEKVINYDKRGESVYSYFYIENNSACSKLLSYLIRFSGPNYETRSYASFKKSNGKKILYLGFRMIDDGPYGAKYYKIDLSNIEKSQLFFSYDEVKGNEEFIKNNVKLLISYHEGYDGKYVRSPKKSYSMYKKADFNSEAVGTISKDEKVFLCFGWMGAKERQIIFEDEKDGFWVQCVYPVDNSKTCWIWID